MSKTSKNLKICIVIELMIGMNTLSPELEEKFKKEFSELFYSKDKYYSLDNIALILKVGFPGSPYEKLKHTSMKYYCEKFGFVRGDRKKYTTIPFNVKKEFTRRFSELYYNDNPRRSLDEIIEILEFGKKGTIFEELKRENLDHYRSICGLPARQFRRKNVLKKTIKELKYQKGKLKSKLSQVKTEKEEAIKKLERERDTILENIETERKKFEKEKKRLTSISEKEESKLVKSLKIELEKVKRQRKKLQLKIFALKRAINSVICENNEVIKNYNNLGRKYEQLVEEVNSFLGLVDNVKEEKKIKNWRELDREELAKKWAEFGGSWSEFVKHMNRT